MCVTFLAHFNNENRPSTGAGSKYKLIILNNRDEIYDRFASKLHWENGVLAGRDEEASEHGTWFAINEYGRIGILLSISEIASTKPVPTPSRGKIPLSFLNSQTSMEKFCEQLTAEADHYHGFQFLALEPDHISSGFKLASLANRFVDEIKPIFWSSGKIYGFGNSPAKQPVDNTIGGAEPFQKVIHGEKLFENVLKKFDAENETEYDLLKQLIHVGRDRTICYPDPQILKQKTTNPVGTQCNVTNPEIEPIKNDSTENHEPKKVFDYKFLCSLFVQSPENRYGTKSHSILFVDYDDNVSFYESRQKEPPKTKATNEDLENIKWEIVNEKFKIKK